MNIPISQVPLSPESRLLILLSRQTLSPDSEAAVLNICDEITDWSLVQQRAQEHFVLPTVYRHLYSVAKDKVPEGVLTDMRRHALHITADALRIASAQRQFSEVILRANGIRHVFVKGQALAGCYYSNPGARFSRDVDVLVDRSDLVRVCEIAQENGYQVFPDRRRMSRRDLAASAKFRPVQTLICPNGVLFEVHSELDKTGLLFNTEALIDAAEHTEVNGSLISVLPIAHHFVFVCLHSTRHLWSHSSWLIDIDAIISSDDFDMESTKAVAIRTGSLPTVDACIELYKECARSEPSRLRLPERACDLFDALIMHLEMGPAIEFDLRRSRPLPDYAFLWQASRMYRLRTILSKRIDFIHPNFKDYESFPLPSGAHWLYYLSRPFSGFFRRKRRSTSENDE